MTEAIKHAIGAIASPLAISFFLAAAASIFRTRGRRSAAWLLALAMVVGYGGAVPRVGDWLLRPLERQYPPLADRAPLPKVNYIVVLGSSYRPAAGIPVTAALDGDALARIVEGVRLARRLPQARLVLSGGAAPSGAPTALGYARLARELGVGDDSLMLLDRPRDTAGEAKAVAARLSGAPFLLVTSAAHMPRAMKLMERAGAHPIAAPTAQRALGGSFWRGWIPSASGLRESELAIHEYLGLAALYLRIA